MTYELKAHGSTFVSFQDDDIDLLLNHLAPQGEPPFPGTDMDFYNTETGLVVRALQSEQNLWLVNQLLPTEEQATQHTGVAAARTRVRAIDSQYPE